MSKRFIDTELFNDRWFMDLSKDGKIGYIYYITKCDHAGILDLNDKLFYFQTGVKWENVVKELGDRLINVKEYLYFMPKYIKFQYPNWPNSKVKQQDSAIKILLSYGLVNEDDLTVKQDLSKSYDNDNVNDSVIVKEKVKVKFSQFYDSELEASKDKEGYEYYLKFVKFLFGDNEAGEPLKNVLAMPNQVTFRKFKIIHNNCIDNGLRYGDYLKRMNNWGGLKKNLDVEATLSNWMRRDKK